MFTMRGIYKVLNRSCAKEIVIHAPRDKTFLTFVPTVIMLSHKLSSYASDDTGYMPIMMNEGEQNDKRRHFHRIPMLHAPMSFLYQIVYAGLLNVKSLNNLYRTLMIASIFAIFLETLNKRLFTDYNR